MKNRQIERSNKYQCRNERNGNGKPQRRQQMLACLRAKAGLTSSQTKERRDQLIQLKTEEETVQQIPQGFRGVSESIFKTYILINQNSKKLIDAYPLSKLNQKDIKNLHRSVRGSEIKTVIKRAVTENIPRLKWSYQSIMSKMKNTGVS